MLLDLILAVLGIFFNIKQNNKLTTFDKFVDKLVNHSDIDFKTFLNLLDLMTYVPHNIYGSSTFKEYKDIIEHFLDNKKGINYKIKIKQK